MTNQPIEAEQSRRNAPKPGEPGSETPDDPPGAADGTSAGGITFRGTTTADGAEIWRLVRESGVLDENSCYAYLLLCRDFADTCLVAERVGEIVGFVTAYRPPNRSESIFVWQIGVAAAARKQGLGKRLLKQLLARPACSDVRFLEATVSPSNRASRRLFESVAEELGVACDVSAGFAASDFRYQDADHDAEDLFRIGPLDRPATGDRHAPAR
jgi:L-2,4-diaminobutyric acid acetyltransferase